MHAPIYKIYTIVKLIQLTWFGTSADQKAGQKTRSYTVPCTSIVFQLEIHSFHVPFERYKVMNEDGHTSNIRDKILTINVKPGWRPGTKITFPNEGDQGPNNIPGNFLHATKPESQFDCESHQL